MQYNIIKKRKEIKIMKAETNITQEHEATSVQRVQQEYSEGGTAQIADNRESTMYQQKLQKGMHVATENSINPIQRKANKTGLPDNLKLGIEKLSGYSMDDVKVHYNSNKPAQLKAHAYAQGTDIHLASDQEKHLPHEAWHVVQQMQGRVKPTMQLKSKAYVNNDVVLEKEANLMGIKALDQGRMTNQHTQTGLTVMKNIIPSTSNGVAQLKIKDENHGTLENADFPHCTYNDMYTGQMNAIKSKFGEEAWNGKEILKDNININDKEKRYLVQRSAKNLRMEQCIDMVNSGILSGKLRDETDNNNSNEVNKAIEKQIEEHKTNYYDTNEYKDNELGIALYKHKGSDYKTSEFVSTSYDSSFLYYPEIKSKFPDRYILLTIIELSNQDRVYNPTKMLGKRGINAFAEEKEISVVGGIRPERIVWAVAIPMPMETKN